ncbi:hypothetical protein GEOBRER4_n2817 [Citrifermentans bremense]|uniref:CHAT domain-containing protein n=1 Tax=Citrifermentans bremense TaxID=60035 RepID=A0A6S6M3I9_9BACT|nr:hypothetical protein [Citrifermentans bremense]BCG47959.1 hypothetical protein GEOBRER4_n2817 [Citrifermentans bremense]
MAKTALMILESPWWEIDENPGRASVFPFFHGLERLDDNVKVYHTTFYEGKSFRLALEDLSNTSRFNRLFLYIASHGNTRMIGKVPLTAVIDAIKSCASCSNIEGLIIGSCLAGMQVDLLKEAITGTSLVWAMGYAGYVDWFTSTLIDLAVMRGMLGATKRQLGDRDLLFQRFRQAIARFDLDYALATDLDDKELSLRKAVSLVIQPKNVQGAKPVSMSL